jgi:Protein of unknown function (DUF1115)
MDVACTGLHCCLFLDHKFELRKTPVARQKGSSTVGYDGDCNHQSTDEYCYCGGRLKGVLDIKWHCCPPRIINDFTHIPSVLPAVWRMFTQQKGIKHYKRLMLDRIRWSENARSDLIARGNVEVLAGQTTEEEVDLSENKCELVWEGKLRGRNFAKWVSEWEANNDASVRNFLGKNAQAFWKLAIGQRLHRRPGGWFAQDNPASATLISGKGQFGKSRSHRDHRHRSEVSRPLRDARETL